MYHSDVPSFVHPLGVADDLRRSHHPVDLESHQVDHVVEAVLLLSVEEGHVVLRHSQVPVFHQPRPVGLQRPVRLQDQQ